jgi:hypothetical protein
MVDLSTHNYDMECTGALFYPVPPSFHLRDMSFDEIVFRNRVTSYKLSKNDQTGESTYERYIGRCLTPQVVPKNCLMMMVLSLKTTTMIIATKSNDQYMRLKTVTHLKYDLRSMSELRTEPLWQVFQTCVDATSIDISWLRFVATPLYF